MKPRFFTHDFRHRDICDFKMAPLWVACRLSLSAVLSLSVLTCFMLCLTQCASSVLIYDRLSLLNLEEISNKLLYQAMSIPHYAAPPLLLSIPDCLRSWPCSLPPRRRRRRRGRRGGLAIKLKRFLRLHREPQLQLGFHAEGLAGKCFIRWRSLEPVHGWIICVSHLGGAAPCNPLSSVWAWWSVHGPSSFTTSGKFVYGLFGIHASA